MIAGPSLKSLATLKNIVDSIGVRSEICEYVPKLGSALVEYSPHLLIVDCESDEELAEIKNCEEIIQSSGSLVLLLVNPDSKPKVEVGFSHPNYHIYVKPLISKNLTEIIRNTLSELAVKKIKFDLDVTVKLTMECDLIEFNDFELIVKSPMKSPKGVDVFLKSKGSEFLFDGAHLSTEGRGYFESRGCYVEHLNIVAANDSFLQRVRQLKRKRAK